MGIDRSSRRTSTTVGGSTLQDDVHRTDSKRRSRRLRGEVPEHGPLQSLQRQNSADKSRRVGTATLPVMGSVRPVSALPAVATPITRGFRQAQMPTDRQQLLAIHLNAKLADFVYTRDAKSLPGDWAPSTDLAEQVCDALNLTPQSQSQVDNGFGTLVDPDSGLVASVLVSPGTKEVVVAFGGTTAGAVAGSALPRVFGNFSTSIKQWQANVGAGLGFLPASYQQADTTLRTLGQLVGQEPWDGYTLRTVGHSKAGGEAAYAALAQPQPLKADIFSPAHLSRDLINQLPVPNVIKAVDLVRSYSVETDLVPGLRNVPGGPIEGVGTAHTIPVDLRTGTSALNVHEQFVRHLEGHMRRCEGLDG